MNTIEFELRFVASRINEIRQELKELKDDADSDDDIDEEIEDLKNELKKTRQSKNDSFQIWQVLTEAEEVRRTMLDIEGGEEDASTPLLTTSPIVGSRITSIDSLQQLLKRKRNTNILGNIGVDENEERLDEEPEHIDVDENEEKLDEELYVTLV